MRNVKSVPASMLAGLRCEVFFNLHLKLFSVRVSGRTIAHVADFVMKDCKLVVQPGGRASVLRTGKKTIHAFIRGTMGGTADDVQAAKTRISYNPKRSDCFESIQTGQAVHAASVVCGHVTSGYPWVFCKPLAIGFTLWCEKRGRIAA